MLANFLKIALRNFWRNKTFSLINLFGLALGTVCCLYILLFVQEHRGYDRHHREAGNLYRIISDLGLGNNEEIHHMATCSPPIPPAMQADFPEVEMATRMCNPPGVEQHLLKAGDKAFYEKAGYYVDSTFFRQNEETIGAVINLIVFLFITTGIVYETQHWRNPSIGNYIDALYFTVTTLTTTGFGDITLKGSLGRLIAVIIMIFGVTLFLRLLQTLLRPQKVRFACPECGLQRHEVDAVFCKACGTRLNIPDEGRF